MNFSPASGAESITTDKKGDMLFLEIFSINVAVDVVYYLREISLLVECK